MKTLIGVIILFPAMLAAAAGSVSAQTVTGSVGRGQVPRGGSARGEIVIEIPDGLHVNSNRPSSKYAIPTSVRLSGDGVAVTRVNYPRGRDKMFQFSDVPINVYEGRVAFPFTVKVPAGYRGNVVRVRAAVTYQPCTTEVCYPPKTKDITMTARVR